MTSSKEEDRNSKSEEGTPTRALVHALKIMICCSVHELSTSPTNRQSAGDGCDVVPKVVFSDVCLNLYLPVNNVI